MSEATTPDRDDQMLARLAEFDLAAAERVHGRLMAAEEVSELAELGRTYQRIARSLRQTLALKAKLKRDREAAASKPAPDPKPPGGVAVARRLQELRTAVTRVIWTEAERQEDSDFADFLEEGLEDGLTTEMLSDRFCDETLDDHVARFCLKLGLPSEDAERWRDLPDPPDDAPERRSSA
jgi:transcription initiation factor TFIIIB Brf1 subunit/transcription initiation factor TFIIB